MTRGTCHMSCVICHMSPVTCHMSCVTCNYFFLFFGQSGETSWWRVCYQSGLPRLVSIVTLQNSSVLLTWGLRIQEKISCFTLCLYWYVDKLIWLRQAGDAGAVACMGGNWSAGRHCQIAKLLIGSSCNSSTDSLDSLRWGWNWQPEMQPTARVAADSYGCSGQLGLQLTARVAADS